MNTIALVVNSNMLPQGARPAASPRSTTPLTLSRNPITVRATPIRPKASTLSRTAAGSSGRTPRSAPGTGPAGAVPAGHFHQRSCPDPSPDPHPDPPRADEEGQAEAEHGERDRGQRQRRPWRVADLQLDPALPAVHRDRPLSAGQGVDVPDPQPHR